MTRNILIILIVILGLLVIVGLIILNLTERKLGPLPTDRIINLKDIISPQKPPIPQETKPQTLTGLEVAQKTALFLDKSQKADGTFQLFYTCDKGLSSTCRKADTSFPPKHGLIILAYLDLYQQTKNESYKKIADRFVNNLLAKCQDQTQYCESDFFPLFGYWQLTKDQKYLNAMLKVADKPLADLPSYNHLLQHHVQILEMLYQATEDRKYLDKLQQIADKILVGGLDNHEKNHFLYQEGGLVVRALSGRIIKEVVLPAYRVSKDGKYLKFAQNFYDQAQIIKHFDDYKNHKNSYDLIVAMDNLLNLAELGVSPAFYLTQAREIAQRAILTLWDTPENRIFDGDYGWLDSFRDTNNSKRTITNGWLVDIFLKMKGQTFNL